MADAASPPGTDDLETLFLEHSPSEPSSSTDDSEEPTKTTIGLVGYPNVGKSSTINALLDQGIAELNPQQGRLAETRRVFIAAYRKP